MIILNGQGFLITTVATLLENDSELENTDIKNERALSLFKQAATVIHFKTCSSMTVFIFHAWLSNRHYEGKARLDLSNNPVKQTTETKITYTFYILFNLLLTMCNMKRICDIFVSHSKKIIVLNKRHIKLNHCDKQPGAGIFPYTWKHLPKIATHCSSLRSDMGKLQPV